MNARGLSTRSREERKSEESHILHMLVLADLMMKRNGDARDNNGKRKFSVQLPGRGTREPTHATPRSAPPLAPALALSRPSLSPKIPSSASVSTKRGPSIMPKGFFVLP